ncbi:MAG: hypothetical protein A4E61_00749 [Syntrophorhabdus sp. PtaB.Bin184]|nr:MAG: hypothetical protein A4E61_00749 [Syntrophorhabdus sp. PtaB.Bin184]
MVKRIPQTARCSRVSTSTAVSASHIPSGSRPNLSRKSLIPQITCVLLSRELASGMMIWLYTWARAFPWPDRWETLSLSASRIPSYTAGAKVFIHASRVGPKLKLILE